MTGTEIVTLERDILVAGLSLDRAGLPFSFEGLGNFWGAFTSGNYRRNIPNYTAPYTEYGISAMTVPDYIIGCGVSEMPGAGEALTAFVIPAGQYVKDTFSAKSFHKLTSEALLQRDVAGWAEAHDIVIDDGLFIEVYPMDEIENGRLEMYTLTPVIH